MKHTLKTQLSFSEDGKHLVANDFQDVYSTKVWLFDMTEKNFLKDFKSFIEETLEEGHKIEWVK